MSIKITKEYWTQPGAMKYDYRHVPSGGLYNVGSADATQVKLWTIDAWGQTQRWAVTPHEFHAKFIPHGEPSLYEQMDAVKKRT